MNIFLRKAMNILGSRFARNSYFWLLVLWLKVGDARSLHQVLLILIFWALLLTLFCINNFILVPLLLARRKIVEYFILCVLTTAVIAVVYTLALKITLIRFPEYDAGDVSLIINYISENFGAAATAYEVLPYFVIFAFLVFLFTGAWYVNDYLRHQRKLEEIKKEQDRAELHFLKTQLSPHFLFNTLNNIYALAGKKSDLTQDVVLKLSDILRYLLYKSNVPLIPFEQEKQIILAYIELEKLQLSEETNLDVYIEADDSYLIPPLLWLPILENMFKHGTHFINSHAASFAFTVMDNILDISSENHYKKSYLPANGGIGLQNLQKRLFLLYPAKHQIMTHEVGGRFAIQIKVNLT